MEQPTNYRRYAQKIGISLLAGSLVWVILLARGASVLRGATNDTYHVSLGPLLLNTISKQPAKEGFVASFSFEAGLLWYMLLLIAAGILAALLTVKNPDVHSSPGR